MKEMDPSEELEFEHLMREDENLLIEVESLRATQKKFSEFGLNHPPETLCKKIVAEAVAMQQARVNRAGTMKNYFIKGLAAAVMLSVLTGGYMYYTNSAEFPAASSTATNEAITPWVDRNEVLRVPGLNNSNTNVMPVSGYSPAPNWETEVQRSYEKLQLVKFYNNNNGAYQGFHLTGTSD